MRTSQVVPIVLRRSTDDRTEVLVFTHSEAGTQLVKASVEAGESVSSASLRELAEESGITGAACGRDLGTWEHGPDDQVWHFPEKGVWSALPDAWRYRERLAMAGLLGSMSRARNPFDNAHAESFMKTLKHEADLPARLPHDHRRHRAPPPLSGAHLQKPAVVLRSELSVADPVLKQHGLRKTRGGSHRIVE